MIGEELLFKTNNVSFPKRYNIRKGGIYFNNNEYNFDGKMIKEIIGFVNGANSRYSGSNIPIIFDFGNIKFKDKLTYIILECICNYIMSSCNRKVIIGCSVKNTIWTEGIRSTPLQILSTGKKNSFSKFQEKFRSEIYERHYRRIISASEWDDEYLNCKIMEQVDWFLKNLQVDRDNRSAMAEVVSELAGNVHDHTDGDCLIDIDVTREYEKESSEGKYYGLNLVVLNFSKKLFGEGIKEKIQKDDTLGERFTTVKESFENHKSFFDEDTYIEEDFYNITAFQHKISGRNRNYTNGGTGLTKLIRSLEERSDTHNCYMVSGERAIFFRQELLNYNEDKWIGFNECNDYFNTRPSDDVLGVGHIYMPGTAYNLNFAMRKEGSENE